MKILFGVRYFGRRLLFDSSTIQSHSVLSRVPRHPYPPLTSFSSVVLVVAVVIVIIYLFYVIVNEFTRVLTIVVSEAFCLLLKSRHINSFEIAATHLLPSFDECPFLFINVVCVFVSISLDKMDNRSHSMCVPWTRFVRSPFVR